MGQLENTVADGTCSSFRPFFSRLVDMARMSPVELKHRLSAEVVKFMIDLWGVLSVLVRESPPLRPLNCIDGEYLSL